MTIFIIHGRWEPLLEADFWLLAFVAEEKDVLVGDLGGLKLVNDSKSERAIGRRNLSG
jgi:hypothetical protein